MESLGVLVIVLFGSSIKAYGVINQLSYQFKCDKCPLISIHPAMSHNKFRYFDFASNF